MKRGRSLFAQGMVEIFDVDAGGFGALVTDVEDEPFEVNIGFEDEDLISHLSCECMEFDENDCCEHTWAAILQWDAIQNELKPKKSGRSRKSKRKTRAKVTKPDPQWLKTMESATKGGSATGLPRLPAPEPPVALSATSQFWYVIDVADSLRCGRISLDLRIQQQRANGVPGTIKEFKISRDSLKEIQHPEHSAVMDELLNCAEGSARSEYSSGPFGYYVPPSYSRIELRPLMQTALLPKIAATGRLCWRLSRDAAMEDVPFIEWDDAAPWQTEVTFREKRKTQEWLITAELVRTVESPEGQSQQQSRPLSDIVLLDSGGVALFPDCLAQIDLNRSAGWLQMLRSTSEIRIPFADRDEFLKRLAATPRLAGIDMPQRLTRAQKNVTCQPRLRLLGPDRVPHRMRHMKFVFGTFEFLYGETTVSIRENQSMLWDDQRSNLLVRDTVAENAFARQLTELNVQPIAQDFSSDGIDIKIPEEPMPVIVRRLLETGWQVEAAGVRLKQSGRFSFGVTSGQDWFELNAELEFDGVQASLPDLLQALRKGEEFVRLSDGSKGVLPEDWLRRYSVLANMGEVVGDAIRFRPSQAMLLDSLLAAQDTSTQDRAFKTFIRKLKGFSGIKPQDAPKTFHGELRDYQKDGLSWLNFLNEFRLGGCLADDMGLGKTIQVLALLESRRTRRLKAKEVRKPSLVVVPKSLVFNWIEEASRFAPNLNVLNYTGLERSQRLASEGAAANVIVTTYGSLRKDIVTLKEMDFDYVVLDEAQAIKNSASQASKACRLLVSDHRLAMTGTPVENHLNELWSLFEFLNPGMLGSASVFQKLTVSTNDDSARTQALQTLSLALRPFLLRRTKTQVLKELPGKTEQTILCEMPSKQRKQYNQLRDYYRTQLSAKVEELGVNKAKIHVLEALLRLRQAACHPGLIDSKLADQSSAKLDAAVHQLRELVAEGHKALVFSQFTSLLSIVKQRLDSEGITYEYLDGKISNRQQRVDRFQTDDACPLFLISLKAGGHGLNLTAADYVFILDPWWNPAVEAQAVDRAHRMGQDRHVFAYRLICKDTVEERILEMQKDKKELADAIVSADSSLIKNLTADDLQMLLS
ncbi:MAG: SNF2-related protein [Planctomycetaceae bacterium]